MGWEGDLKKGTPGYEFASSDANWIRVLAGPGTGKSYSLKRRIIRLLSNGVDPSKLLVITFTSVAADDLKKDIKDLKREAGIGDNREIEVSTLHSLCRKLLDNEKRLGKLPGKSGQNARLLLDFEIKTMLRDLVPDCGKVGKNKNSIKSKLLRSYENDVDGRAFVDEGNPQLLQQYRQFSDSLSAWKEMYGGLLPGELITQMCRYLKENSDARERLAYQYVMVDEYQDLNSAEQELVELLTAKKGFLAVIGDDDQSIYGFKGASSQGIRKFAENHTGCKTFSFNECRRCPTDIVEMANQLIERNKDRDAKKMKADLSFQEGDYVPCHWNTPEEEVKGLCNLIKTEVDGGLFPGKIVVLTPTRGRGKKLQQALVEVGIPTVSCFRDDVFDSREAREAFSKLSILAQPEDMVSWRYLLGEDKGERKAKSFCRVQKIAEDEKCSILDILDECIDKEKPRKIQSAHVLVDCYDKLKTEMDKIREEVGSNPDGLVKMLYLPEGNAFADILNKVISDNVKKKGTDDWLPAIRDNVLKEIFYPEPEYYSNKVRILSLHMAKGLSAPMVVIMSAIDELLPGEGNTKSKWVEEQRRLYYVAITRCKGATEKDEQGNPNYPGKLVVSYFTGGEDGEKEYKKSRFVEEAEMK